MTSTENSVGIFASCENEPIPMTDQQDAGGVGGLVERLRSSAAAFREHTVYDSEGDPLRLIVQADEMDEAAARLTSLEREVEGMREAFEPFAKLAEKYVEGDYGFRLESTRNGAMAFTREDVERARAALSTQEPQRNE